MRAMDCAIILLEHAERLGISVTNLQLQKYLHFINANFWRTHNRLLINDSSFETWTYGPMNRQLYFHFNFYGSAPIDVEFEKTRISTIQEKINHDEEVNHDEEIKYLENNIDNFLQKLNEIDIFRLVNITHEEPIWKKNKDKILNGRHYEYKEEDMNNVAEII